MPERAVSGGRALGTRGVYTMEYPMGAMRPVTFVQWPIAGVPLALVPYIIMPFECPTAGRKKRQRPHMSRPLGWS